MKRKFKFLPIFIMAIFFSVINTKQASAQGYDVGFQVFYDQLSPYGQWIDYPNYGYVWIPDVSDDFEPYSTDGYWIMTDYGMTWVSNYRWGWAPFHYGRWDFDDNFGWFWVPDRVWGPAWVVWRSSRGYYGWAPMQPGISITLSFGGNYHHHHDHWVFVRDRDIDRTDLYRCHVGRYEHDRIIRNSVIINNTYIDNSRNETYIAGPKRDDLRRHIGRDVHRVSVHEYNTPGQNMQNDRMDIYRPRVTGSNDRKENTGPKKIYQVNEVKRHTNNNNTRIDNNNRIQNNDHNRTNNNNQNGNNNVKRSDNNQNNNVNRTDNNKNQNNNVNRNNNNQQNQNNDVNRTDNNKNQNNNVNRTDNNKNQNNNVNRTDNNRQNQNNNVNRTDNNKQNQNNNVNRNQNKNSNQNKNVRKENQQNNKQDNKKEDSKGSNSNNKKRRN